MSVVDFDALDRGARLRVVWGFFWRNSVTTAISMAIAFLVGTVVGYVGALVLAILGVPIGQSAPVLGVLSAIVGIGAGAIMYWVYVDWLLSSKLGRYRLCLVTEVIDPAMGTGSTRSGTDAA